MEPRPWVPWNPGRLGSRNPGRLGSNVPRTQALGFEPWVRTFLEPRRPGFERSSNPGGLGSFEPSTPGFERSSSWVRTFLEPRRWVSNPAPGFESKPLGFFVLFLCWLAVMLEWDLEFGVVSDCLSCLNEI
ncbi:hypothetical protein SLEP1_g50937 [Rubroshorea leprosula]|uniref:Uncharacterized protein n=1 Tax=Rubroshorea leprosula TaxID=152421 RepID=A0AAV5M3R0_9ROSI|nr:hypothetical protein SLEP1_g50937 [Rubroshorea leprosula]